MNSNKVKIKIYLNDDIHARDYITVHTLHWNVIRYRILQVSTKSCELKLKKKAKSWKHNLQPKQSELGQYNVLIIGVHGFQTPLSREKLTWCMYEHTDKRWLAAVQVGKGS